MTDSDFFRSDLLTSDFPRSDFPRSVFLRSVFLRSAPSMRKGRASAAIGKWQLSNTVKTSGTVAIDERAIVTELSAHELPVEEL